MTTTPQLAGPRDRSLNVGLAREPPGEDPGTEPVAPLVDEREPLPRGRAVDQRLRRLTQDLVFKAGFRSAR